MKKTTLSIAIAVSLATPFSAWAGSPTFDAGNSGTHAANLGTNANTTAQQVLKTLKDYGLDQVAYMIAQKIGQKMATATINKTTGGASNDKDPNYIQDFARILSDIEEQQRDLWTTKLLTSKNPYARNISTAILSSPAGDVLPQFTLGNVLNNSANWQDVGRNLELAGEKGLTFYSQLALPQNTSLGASMIADQVIAKNVAAKKESERLKIGSSGFLPNTECNIKISDYKKNVQTIMSNADQIHSNQNQINYNDLDAPLTEDSIWDNTPAPTDPEDPVVTEVTTPTPTAQQQAAANQDAVLGKENAALYMNTGAIAQDLATDTAGCIEEMIKNPVATTQVLTNEAGKFGMDMTKNIQGWGQIVAGLFVSLFNGFVNQGLSSLKADYGQVKKASNVGGPEQLMTRDANGNIQQNTNFASAPATVVDLRNDFEPAVKSTSENLAVMEDVRKELLKVPGKLATLDMCLPGPDFIGLPKRMDDYYTQQTSRIMKRSMMGSDDALNAYQSQVLNFIERDYGISRAETTRDMNDDTRNIPGAGVMRNMIMTFQTKKQALQTLEDAIVKSNESVGRLRQVNTELKSSISFLQGLTNADGSNMGFGSLPGLVFTEAEWNALPPASRDQIYQWLLDRSGIPPTNDPDLSAEDDKKDYVISSSWGLWEYPHRFLSGKKWPDEVNGVSNAENAFLTKKNEIRSIFAAIKDSIPTSWEIEKNEQLLTAYKKDNAETDNLIHDCDMMRVLVIGDAGTNTAPSENAKKKWNGNNQAFLNDLIQNKDTYFKSEQMRNSLALPNMLTVQRTWAEDGCIPNSQFTQLYQAEYPTGQDFADHGGYPGGDYTCMGDFGYTYDAIPKINDSLYFNGWIDRSSNAYQTQTHIGGIDALYGWRWPVRRFVPDSNQYGTGWTVSTILKTKWYPDGGNNSSKEVHPDGGEGRFFMCRLNSVLGGYGKYSGSQVGAKSFNFYCSSKWTDTSVSEAIGMFIINSL